MIKNPPIWRLLSACAALVMVIQPVFADEMPPCDVVLGEQVFQKCAVCHALEPEAAHGAGPNLNKLMGRPVGKIAGFKFSKHMRESAATWTDEHLDAFLEDPAGVYRRTRMAFGGLKNISDRSALICYLKAH